MLEQPGRQVASAPPACKSLEPLCGCLVEAGLGLEARALTSIAGSIASICLRICVSPCWFQKESIPNGNVFCFCCFPGGLSKLKIVVVVFPRARRIATKVGRAHQLAYRAHVPWLASSVDKHLRIPSCSPDFFLLPVSVILSSRQCAVGKLGIKRPQLSGLAPPQ